MRKTHRQLGKVQAIEAEREYTRKRRVLLFTRGATWATSTTQKEEGCHTKNVQQISGEVGNVGIFPWHGSLFSWTPKRKTRPLLVAVHADDNAAKTDDLPVSERTRSLSLP